MTVDDVLDIIAWAEREFGSLHTNRVCTRRDVMRAVKAGWVESAGMCEQCDDDGSRLTERRAREGFVLTEAGRQRLAAWRAAEM